MPFALVALPIPIDKTYTYRIPGAFDSEAVPGAAVVVPFGRRMLTGVVTDRTDEDPAFDVREIADVLDATPVLTDEQLRLTRFIAEYYVCGWGEAIRASLPPGLDATSEYRIRRTVDASRAETADHAGLTTAQQRLLECIPAEGDVSLAALRQEIPDVSLARLRTLEARGQVAVEMQLRGPRTRARLERFVRLAKGAPPEGDARGKRQQAVLEALVGTAAVAGTDAEAEAKTDAMTDAAAVRQSELLRKTGASSATIRRLEDLGHVVVFDREIDRSAVEAGREPTPRPFALNQAQQAAAEEIKAALDKAAFRTFLLHGITGSGKTEVYIEAAKRARSMGKSAIMLVPEIALTPQTVERFRTRFGDEIAVLHSRMSPGERYDTWRNIRAGDAPIVIGPRSAVLAPVRDLGLIVVDEEHEPSYKQYDPAPRYNARDVAIVRASENGAVCVLGSATPSLESLANARAGKYRLLELPARVETAGKQASLPAVRIVDLRTHLQEMGTRVLSKPLREAIRSRLNAREQTILLQNRRGYAPVVRCEACNWVPECPDCSVSLTWHKARNHLRCHYCGRTARLPRACTSCGEPALSRIGIGTQRVEEELSDAFPEARVVRMDLDTTSTKNAHHDILERFAAGRYDILLGTQMVAKGLDFGRVTLVGVVDADAGLSLPDIRAEERTFHLLTQVAGRAGRADLPGEVILQTRNPGHRIIQYAIRHDYEHFARDILAERTLLDYPPAGRLAALLFSGPEEADVYRIAEDWVRLATRLDPELQILGPSASFVGRVRRRFRMQVMIKVPRGVRHERVRALIRRSLEETGALPTGYRVSVDVDPVGLA